uniref:Uncharacterized protein n=2 Tax=Oryza sativa subsp. japonica TaxID=39947 RepID=Q10FJ0_ORYSJ|nr:hypothetical protein [Oryza sativa Japonica Group]ABF98070.1 retrotransposon protein, putative, Ty3-gypsy subclass [Oryza sativa Japonica Group]
MAAGPRAAARLAVDRAHGREDGGRGRLTGLARSKPRWRRGGAYVAATRAGGRRKKGRPRWTADGVRVHRSKRDGFGLRGAHRSDEGIEKERANGSDSPKGVRRRWNSTAAAGGERKGKSPRGDEDSIKGGGSISGVQGTHFQGRMGLSGAVEVRRREAASGGGRQWRRGHAGWRRSLGWRLRAFGRATELPRKLEGTRVSREGEREGGTTEPGRRGDEQPTARKRALRRRAGEGEEDGRPESRVTRPRTHWLPRCSATDGDGASRAEVTLVRWRRERKRERLGDGAARVL